MFPLTKLEIGSLCSSTLQSTRWIVSTNLFSGLVPRYLSGLILDIHLPTRFGFLSWYPIKGVYKSLQLGTDRLPPFITAAEMLRQRSSVFFYHVRLKRAIRRLSDGVRGPITKQDAKPSELAYQNRGKIYYFHKHTGCSCRKASCNYRLTTEPYRDKFVSLSEYKGKQQGSKVCQ